MERGGKGDGSWEVGPTLNRGIGGLMGAGPVGVEGVGGGGVFGPVGCHSVRYSH